MIKKRKRTMAQRRQWEKYRFDGMYTAVEKMMNGGKNTFSVNEKVKLSRVMKELNSIIDYWTKEQL